jgi:hypothetical protein
MNTKRQAVAEGVRARVGRRETYDFGISTFVVRFFFLCVFFSGMDLSTVTSFPSFIVYIVTKYFLSLCDRG